ncbi:MAG: hypothetical protein CVV24_05650 [Ignavibacteriae bacterium HGW-Ignavibacteriae-3]|nr:MAG: hypothetical protein CVV24_05650 [Ignavibacteriae bacterium HGW-Ignavibacteriae-3]
MNILYSFFIGYILGSFPTAYILLKRYKNVDIRCEGSGNVGAHNSFKVSKSKLIGFSVLSIDLLKGFCTVLIVKLIIGDDFLYIMTGLNAAVFAHCYSPWINFKGGRGIATAGGGSLLISIPILIIWGIVWLIAFIFPRNIHISNISASVFTAVASFVSALSLNRLTSPRASSTLEFGLFVGTLMMIILVKHFDPMKVLLLKWYNKN